MKRTITTWSKIGAQRGDVCIGERKYQLQKQKQKKSIKA